MRHLLLLVAALHGARRRPARRRGRLSRPVRLTVAASGDLLIHTPVAQRALALGGGRRYDFAPLFAPVRRVIAGADLALCHMETPLVPGPVQGYPVFHTPPDLARSVEAGGLGRVQHGLEPLARRRPVRDRLHPSRAAPGGREGHRHLALGPGAPADRRCSA